jgi:hypothetical protein
VLRWVIDTGSVIQIRREVPNSVRGRVTAALDARVASDALIYPPEVIGELERAAEEISKKGSPDPPYAWAKKNEMKATRYGRLYADARAILDKVPNLIDPDKVAVGDVDDADPYVIALAVKLKVQGDDVTIITDDYQTKPKKMALADAAGVFRIPCVRFRTFLITEGIWDGREGM